MIRREYHPAVDQAAGPADRQLADFREGKLTLEELCRLYCTHVYARVGSYVQTARRLNVDRRTVKKYVKDSGI